MGYILKKDQQDLVNLAKDFAEKKVAPFVHELDQAKETMMFPKSFSNCTIGSTMLNLSCERVGKLRST